MTSRMTAAEKQELVRSITALVKCNVLQKEDYNALMRIILNACNRTLKSIDDEICKRYEEDIRDEENV